jgi:5-formyltetrahydrofolate cyclo-ligase
MSPPLTAERIPIDKPALRRYYRELRRQWLPRVESSLRQQVGRLLSRNCGQGRIGLYSPLRGEADLLRPLITGLPGLAGRLALPAVDAGELLYRPWAPGDPLRPDACGIPAPTADHCALAPEALDLLLIPALAIDHQGIRLGYGGGWYDRLRGQGGWEHLPTLAVLPQACVAATLPLDPWDIPLQGWVSEQGPTWL